MGLDIRWPIGLMFSLIGAMLTGYGLFNRVAAVTKINGDEISIDLIWGIVLLVFGAFMLFGAITGKKNPPAN
jgi:FtsH-binding integral membrane protein